jgi:pimeloyl-ACP methyl ester carboxylesterase
MNRRDVLKSAVSLAGAGTLVGPPDGQSSGGTRALTTQGGSYVGTRDGQQLFYTDWGAGDPVVFLAGWALPSDMWEYQMVPLSEHGLRCIAYDRRGHGRSSRPGAGYDYDSLAEDLAAVLDALDLQRATLVGLSMAGGEIVRYLTRYGMRRVARIVLIGTSATPFATRSADNPAGIPAERFEYFRRNVLLRDYPKWLEDNRQPFFVPDTSPQMQEWVRSMMLGTSLKALVECSRSMTGTDFRPELSKVRVPTLVIHGDKDVSAAIDLTGRPTAKMIPGAVLKVYDGAPHGLFLTHMARLTEDILGFARA